jgi:hypothetical protein
MEVLQIEFLAVLVHRNLHHELLYERYPFNRNQPIAFLLHIISEYMVLCIIIENVS